MGDLPENRSEMLPGDVSENDAAATQSNLPDNGTVSAAVTRTRRVAPVRSVPVPPPYMPPTRTGCADLVSAFFVLASIGVLGFTVLLIASPYSALNPFPPPPRLSINVIATPLPTLTPTLTLTPLPPTPTVPTPLPTATETPTETPLPTITNTPVVALTDGSRLTPSGPTATPAPIFTRSPSPFTVDSIRYQANTTAESCNWQSVAGTVTDLNGQPVTGIAVQIISADGGVNEYHYTGDQDGARNFGTGGFEIYLGDTPARSAYTIQLRGRSGSPISEAVLVETRAPCEENVTVVRFVQNHLY